MIDIHIHCVPPNLPGAGSLNPRLNEPLPSVASWLRAEMRDAGVTAALCMGNLSDLEDDPLGLQKSQAVAELVPGLHLIGAANPKRSDGDWMRRVEAAIRSGQIVALKGYLGYVHYYPSDPGYRPYYELAARYRLPFIFHTGDTYSPYAKLKYAHPLGVDEVAVDHPDVRFVMAHVGNPWMIDAAEVVYKNVNVWIDLSGLIVGNDLDLAEPEARPAIDEVLSRVAAAFDYAERPNRFLYGSDWPLAPMSTYRDFIQMAIPEKYHEQIFDSNSRSLFGIAT